MFGFCTVELEGVPPGKLQVQEVGLFDEASLNARYIYTSACISISEKEKELPKDYYTNQFPMCHDHKFARSFPVDNKL